MIKTRSNRKSVIGNLNGKRSSSGIKNTNNGLKNDKNKENRDWKLSDTSSKKFKYYLMMNTEHDWFYVFALIVVGIADVQWWTKFE